MAKKTPRSNKKEQAEPTPRKSKITKSTKKKDQGHDGSQLQLFSEGFYAKVDEFKQLYNDINQNILGAGKDAEFNLQLKLQGVSKVLEQNCSNILKNHLEEAEKWLGEKIQAFRQKIKNLQDLQGEAENIFEKTGVLNKEEIKQSLAALQEKIVQERGSLQHFENLHARSKAVYE